MQTNLITEKLIDSIIQIHLFIHPTTIPPINISWMDEKYRGSGKPFPKGSNEFRLYIDHCSTIELIHLLTEIYGYCGLSDVKKIQTWRFHGDKRGVQRTIDQLEKLGLIDKRGFIPGSSKYRSVKLTQEGEKIRKKLLEPREFFIEEIIDLLKKTINTSEEKYKNNNLSTVPENGENLTHELEMDEFELKIFLAKLNKFASKAWQKIETTILSKKVNKSKTKS